MLTAYHRGQWSATDADLDHLLHLSPLGVEGSLSLRDLFNCYGVHRFEYGDTPYTVIRQLVHHLNPDANTTVLDLGSGYGRIGLYGCLISSMCYTGVELVPARVEAARHATRRLGLCNVRFLHADALRIPWPTAMCVCLMNSFLPSQMSQVLPRLAKLRQTSQHTIIASASTAAARLSELPWLEKITEPQWREDYPSPLRIFRVNSR
ncbi:MAG TPA: class I SAM-dependent methyltransferase [Albitalea sp.]|nr:class I SAM-dependent methyltransferase [Albitalea sp.]